MKTLMHCLIIEDELLPAELLSDYIRQTPGLILAGVCTDAIFALDFLRTKTVDALFLDIHLPQLKGLEFLGLLQHPPLVVLTTAYPDYALQGYRHEAVDYLLKPYEFSRFLEAVEKLKRRMAINQSQPNTPDAIFFKVNKQQVRVCLRDIIYVESLKEYCKIHLSGHFIVTQMTLSEMEILLPADDFIRIHRSFLIARHRITAFSATKISLGTLALPVGKTYQKKVHERIGN